MLSEVEAKANYDLSTPVEYMYLTVECRFNEGTKNIALLTEEILKFQEKTGIELINFSIKKNRW